jgi:hypothetical protein
VGSAWHKPHRRPKSGGRCPALHAHRDSLLARRRGASRLDRLPTSPRRRLRSRCAHSPVSSTRSCVATGGASRIWRRGFPEPPAGDFFRERVRQPCPLVPRGLRPGRRRCWGGNQETDATRVPHQQPLRARVLGASLAPRALKPSLGAPPFGERQADTGNTSSRGGALLERALLERALLVNSGSERCAALLLLVRGDSRGPRLAAR